MEEIREVYAGPTKRESHCHSDSTQLRVNSSGVFGAVSLAKRSGSWPNIHIYLGELREGEGSRCLLQEDQRLRELHDFDELVPVSHKMVVQQATTGRGRLNRITHKRLTSLKYIIQRHEQLGGGSNGGMDGRNWRDSREVCLAHYPKDVCVCVFP